MKNTLSLSFFVMLSMLIIGCKESEPSAGSDSTTSLAARQWKGNSYVKLTIGDSSRVIKDLVLLFDFKNDGSCSLSQASSSGSSISGNWEIDAGAGNITLTMKRPVATVTEKLAIVDLNSSRFVFGDTTMYGYSLVPF